MSKHYIIHIINKTMSRSSNIDNKQKFVKKKVEDYETKILITKPEPTQELTQEPTPEPTQELTQEPTPNPKVKKQQKDTTSPNKITSLIGGTLNVMSGKVEMTNYIKNILGLDMKINKAHCAYSAIVEFLMSNFSRMSGKYNVKNPAQADLYEVKIENIQRAIRENKNITNEIKALSENYYEYSNFDYAGKFYAGHKKLVQFLRTKAFDNTTNVDFSKGTINYLCYLVSNIMGMLTKTSCNFTLFAKKNTIGIENYRFSCKEHFNGEFYNLIDQRLNEIKLILEKLKKLEGDEDVLGDVLGDVLEDVLEDE
jgi:hypothetical protein